MKQSIARGRELFYGPIANCVKCHGDSALGDGQMTDYDDWTKELDPAKAGHWQSTCRWAPCSRATFVLAICVWVIYRGGRRPIDLYWRIRNGIDGTPMPAVHP